MLLTTSISLVADTPATLLKHLRLATLPLLLPLHLRHPRPLLHHLR